MSKLVGLEYKLVHNNTVIALLIHCLHHWLGESIAIQF